MEILEKRPLSQSEVLALLRSPPLSDYPTNDQLERAKFDAERGVALHRQAQQVYDLRLGSLEYFKEQKAKEKFNISENDVMEERDVLEQCLRSSSGRGDDRASGVVQRLTNPQARSDRLNRIENAVWVRNAAAAYLEAQPAGKDTLERCRLFVRALACQFPKFLSTLTQRELIQLIDVRPAAEVDLFAIVERCDERLSDHEIGQLLALVKCDEKELREIPGVATAVPPPQTPQHFDSTDTKMHTGSPPPSSRSAHSRRSKGPLSKSPAPPSSFATGSHSRLSTQSSDSKVSSVK